MCNKCFRPFSQCNCSFDSTRSFSINLFLASCRQEPRPINADRPYMPPRLDPTVKPYYRDDDWNSRFGCHHLTGPGFGPKA